MIVCQIQTTACFAEAATSTGCLLSGVGGMKQIIKNKDNGDAGEMCHGNKMVKP